MSYVFVLSAMVMFGADWCWCTDTDIEAHFTTCCLEIPLSMHRSVYIDHIHLNTKICCMYVCGRFASSRFGHIGY